MNFLVLFICIIWSGRIVANLFSYIHLWWVKEYRSDRMRIHFKTDQGKRILWPPFRLPPISPKTITLFIVSCSSLLILFFLIPYYIVLRLFLIDAFAFPLIWFWVIVLTWPTKLYHYLRVQKAMQKLSDHSPMRVIGITGSYGKTSTKEFLATILSTKYKVLKTADSKNSPIGIAEVILHSLKPEHEVFVVEMGAYRRGEIAKMCGMVKPQVGIITAINPQHQDLFKTIAITKQAKYELIASLQDKDVAIFNADNEGALELASKAHSEGRNVWLYTTKTKKLPEWATIIRAEDIKAGMDDIAFTVRIRNEKANAVVSLLGTHQVQNILAAVSASLSIGMKLTDIVDALKKIKRIPKVLQPVPGIHGARFINDTFNNNPDAAKAAIDYLALTKGKKVLVFQPMIELGTYAESAHRDVGAYAAGICDEILVTNSNWISDFTVGVHSVDKSRTVRVVTPQEGAKFIATIVKKDDTVLFKGKEAENVLKTLETSA